MKKNMGSGLIFWDVDTQIDFLTPQGKLYVPGAEKIVPNLERLTRWAAHHDVLIIASACAHQPDDKEFQIYPPHCLAGTRGQAKIPETRLAPALVIPNRRTDLPRELTSYHQVVLEKQRLDVFTNPNIEMLLWRVNVREVVLYGVVTEICVACAARGLLDRGYRIHLVVDAIHHLDEAKARELIEEVQRRGGRLVATDEVAIERAA